MLLMAAFYGLKISGKQEDTTMRRRKTAIALALCVTMLLSLVSPAAAAFPADGGRADAGGSDSTEHQWSHKGDGAKALRMEDSGLTAGGESVALSESGYSLGQGNYYLDGEGEIELDRPITITGEVSLCLNGRTLRLAEDITGSVITVQKNKTLNLYDCGTDGVITGGNAANGGGICNNEGMLTIYGGAISGNTATSYGGGIYSLGKLTIYGGTISGNTATIGGGGICIGGTNGTLTVEGTESSRVVISHNEAGSGGGIYCFKAITIKNSTIDSNTTGSGGGGIYCQDEATITDTTIHGNTTDGNGGGIFSFGKLTIENSTIDGNISTKAGATANNGSFSNGGGGIFYSGTLEKAPTITNSQITNNKAENAYGGGIFSPNLTIESCTITGNSAKNGGGICHPGPSSGSSSSGTTTLSGKTTISGNTDSEGTANNLFLQSMSGAPIYIREGEDKLEAGSTIGVTVLYWYPATPLKLSAETIDGSTPVRKDAAQYFSADDKDNYHIDYNTEKGYLFIDKGPAPPPPHTHDESGETVTLDTPLTAENGALKAGDTTLTAQTIHLYTTLPNRYTYSGTCYVLLEGIIT